MKIGEIYSFSLDEAAGVDAWADELPARDELPATARGAGEEEVAVVESFFFFVDGIIKLCILAIEELLGFFLIGLLLGFLLGAGVVSSSSEDDTTTEGGGGVSGSESDSDKYTGMMM